MIALTPNTAAAVALHAAEGSWVIFVQVIPGAGSQGPIKIEGLRGVQLAPRLMSLVRDCPYEVQLIGLMPSTVPIEHAQAVGNEHHEIHDGWFQPTSELIGFIEHAAQEPLRGLLAETHPGGLDGGDIVDIDGIAEILGVSVPTIRRLIKAETIPYLRFGRTYRFVPSDVIASLQQR